MLGKGVESVTTSECGTSGQSDIVLLLIVALISWEDVGPRNTCPDTGAVEREGGFLHMFLSVGDLQLTRA